MNRHPISRRHLLRGAGAALALPLLDAMLPRSQGAPSKFEPWAKSLSTDIPRVIFCYVPNGVNIAEWIPKDSGEDYTLSPTLEALKDLRDDFTVISGLGHPASEGNHTGADTWLTGANLKAKPGADYTNTISIDQLIAKRNGESTRFKSLELSDRSGTGSAGHSHTLSFDSNGTPLPAENSPLRVFQRLFVPDTSQSKNALLKRYAERRSILDDVAAETASLNNKLGSADQRKLSEYLDGVRDTEKQIEKLQAWVDRPKPIVKSTGLQLASKPRDAHDRAMWLDVMLELSYLAIITDLTRVVTFEWSMEASGFGGGGEDHHGLSHHGGDPEMLAKLAVIDRFFLSKLGRFLGMLKATTEADGTVLDHSIVMYGSGMNSGAGGEHSPKNLPLLVAGGHKLGIKLGRHLAHNPVKHPPLSNVLLAVAQKAGVKIEKFADCTGALNGLV